MKRPTTSIRLHKQNIIAKLVHVNLSSHGLFYCQMTKEVYTMKEFFAGMAFTLVLEGVAAVVIAAEKIKEAIDE